MNNCRILSQKIFLPVNNEYTEENNESHAKKDGAVEDVLSEPQLTHQLYREMFDSFYWHAWRLSSE
jgi:hypothetical protein